MSRSAKSIIQGLIAERDKLKARDEMHVQQFNELSDFRMRTNEAFIAKVDELMAENKALREELEFVKRQPLYSTRLAAERYRWLRDQTWDASPIAVVVNPKIAIKLGHECPSGLRLDQLIDSMRLVVADD